MGNTYIYNTESPCRLRRVCLLAAHFLLCVCAVAQAQTFAGGDSCMQIPTTADAVCRHALKPKDIIIPAAIVGVSAFAVGNGYLEARREDVQDALASDGRRTHADEYMQFAPAAAAYALDLCGVRAAHPMADRTVILAMSYATATAVTAGMKAAFRERRPDGDGRNSFPSGHTARAFVGAELLYQEYRDVSPWIGYAGYAVAAATGYLRIYNNRHYVNDVLAGACIGVLSTKLAYWLYPRVFRRASCNTGVSIVAVPYASADGAGVTASVRF